MSLLIGYEPCGAEGFSPIGQKIDALLATEGFVNEERGKDTHCGDFNDLEIVRAWYGRGRERVSIITHFPETPAPCEGCTFTHTCDHKVGA
jgi:hypothetical protein